MARRSADRTEAIARLLDEAVDPNRLSERGRIDLARQLVTAVLALPRQTGSGAPIAEDALTAAAILLDLPS